MDLNPSHNHERGKLEKYLPGNRKVRVEMQLSGRMKMDTVK